MGLRLPVGNVTVLLGPSTARRGVMAALDDTTGRCSSGHGALGVQRLAAAPGDDLEQRLAAVAAASEGRASIVLVDRLTDGLAARERRTVLASLRPLAAGRAVLVEDADPVAALSVADGALRADPSGGLTTEPVGEPAYLAS